LSRIWNALKEAEQERARASLRKHAETLEKEPEELRQSRRAVHRVPVLVYGSDSERQPFHEETYTLDVNDRGCLLSLATVVSSGQRLVLTNTQNQAEHECRVIHVGKRVNGKAHIGVEFLRPAPEFWLEG
jgi:hypothetical protein